MDLTPQEKNQIRSLVQSPQFATVERLAQLRIDKLNSQPSTRVSQFETLKELFTKEGKIDGILLLLQDLKAASRYE